MKSQLIHIPNPVIEKTMIALTKKKIQKRIQKMNLSTILTMRKTKISTIVIQLRQTTEILPSVNVKKFLPILEYKRNNV